MLVYLCVCMYVRILKSMYQWIHVHLFVYACMFPCLFACMYIYAFSHMQLMGLNVPIYVCMNACVSI